MSRPQLQPDGHRSTVGREGGTSVWPKADDPGMTPATPHGPLASTADVVLIGRLGARVDLRDLPSGDTVTVFTVVVDRLRGSGPPGSRVKVDAIPCQAFRSTVVRRLASVEPGEWVRVEGRLRRRFWRSGSGLGSAMEVEVSRLQRC